MTTPASTIPTLPLARSITLLAGAACAGLAAAAGVLLAIDQTGQLPYAATAAGAGLLGAWLALTPMALAAGRPTSYLGSAALLAMLIRPVVTGATLAGAIVLASLPLRPVLLWGIGFYMILLLVEVALISRQLGARTNPHPGPVTTTG